MLFHLERKQLLAGRTRKRRQSVSQWHFMLMATTIDASLIMTRVTAGIFDENVIDKSTLLNLELKR